MNSMDYIGMIITSLDPNAKVLLIHLKINSVLFNYLHMCMLLHGIFNQVRLNPRGSAMHCYRNFLKYFNNLNIEPR